MNESYDKYSDEELLTEVNEYYPELLEEWISLNSHSLFTDYDTQKWLFNYINIPNRKS
jgi:hypothetical protein